MKVSGKNLQPLIFIFFDLDMRLRAIEFVQQKASRSTKFQDVDLAKELKKLFDDTFFPTW